MSRGNKDVDPADYFNHPNELFEGPCSGAACDHHIRQLIPCREVGTDYHKWLRCAVCDTITWVPRNTSPEEPAELL